MHEVLGVMIVRFLFSYIIVKRIFGNVLVDESEIFVNFSIKGGVGKLP